MHANTRRSPDNERSPLQCTRILLKPETAAIDRRHSIVWLTDDIETLKSFATVIEPFAQAFDTHAVTNVNVELLDRTCPYTGLQAGVQSTGPPIDIGMQYL